MINTKYSSPFFSSVKFFCIICILSYSIFSHAQNWNEVIKSVASDREAGDWFGYDVAMSGDYAIVGALYEDEDTNGTSYKSSAGSAYIFKLSAGVWVQQQKLVATDRRWGDRFGNSVAIDGDYAIVGATRTDYDASGLNFIGNGGAAYVFKRTAGVWSQQQKIVASDRQASDEFGNSVSISGEYAIVGATDEDHDAIGDSTLASAGSAYIFQRTGTTWTQQQKIVAADRAEFDQFGESIAIEGNYAIVGAYQHNYDTSGGGLADNAGAVYVFQQSGGTWTQHQKLVAADRASGDRFGRSVAISGNYIIAGADYHDYDTSGGNAVVDAGAAYVFQQMAGVWTQQQKLVAADRGSRSELYGEAVAINGDYVIVTSKHEDKDINGANTRFGAGAAYIYERVGGTWIEDQKIVASDRETEDYFGFSVAINQAGDALVSAVFEDEDTSGADSLRSAGAVYFFEPACSKIAPANFLGPDISRCTGNQNISVNIPGATYTWSTGQTSDSISVSTSGTYSITVNHAATGCVLKDTIAIDFYTHPPSGLPASLTVCSDTGAILTSKPYAQTLWNTGDTTSAIKTNSSGIYSVTLTDNFGCSNTDSVNLTIYTLPTNKLPASLAVCGDTGVILTSDPYPQTLWNTGDTTSAITVNSSGIYFVTVTDSRGCSNTDSVNLTIYNLPSSGLPASLTVCSDTGAILTSKPYSKTLWNTGDTTSAIKTNSSGIYSVTLTDSFGCSNTDSVNLTIYTLPTNKLPASLTVCSDTGVILTSDPYPQTLWNTGDTTSAITANSSGIYSVTVTDSRGCSNTDSVNVTIYALPSSGLPASLTVCSKIPAVLTSKPYSKTLWNTGDTTSAITANSSGIYFVTVTDSFGCSNTDSVNVIIYTLPTNKLPASLAVCSDTGAILTSKPYSKTLWNTGDTTSAITVNSSGIYFVTVTDSLGCSNTDSVNVTIYALPSSGLPASLAVCSDTGVILTSDPYPKTLWNTGDTTSAITANSSGIYFVTVTDSFGCSNTDSVNLTIYTHPPSGLPASLTVCSDTGVILTSKPYPKTLWNTGDTTSAITANSSGIYFVTLTDSFGCSNTDSVNLTIYALPTVSAGRDSFHCGNNLTLTATGADNYTWSNGATTAATTVTSSGSYSVLGVGSNGCTNSDTVSVQLADLPVPNLGADTTSCLDPILLFAGIFQSYSWSTGGTGRYLLADSSGLYSIIVTNTNGCSATDSIQVSISSRPKINLGNDTVFCGDNLLLTLDPGNTYLWSNGSTTQSINANSSGSYSAVVTNANGCSATDTINVTLLNNASTPVLSRDGNTLHSTIGGTHQWFIDGNPITNESDSFLTIDEIGSYTAVSIDSNGCVSDTSNALAKTAGIGKLPSSSLKVYPNPTNHKVTIDASGLGKIQSIKLYDSQGKLVENTQTTNSSLVHLEWTATNGMLWVVVTTNKGTYRTKVVSIH